jgi:hypothetical protein
MKSANPISVRKPFMFTSTGGKLPVYGLQQPIFLAVERVWEQGSTGAMVMLPSGEFRGRDATPCSMAHNAELTGRRHAQRGGNPTAVPLGAPVERRVGRYY